VLWQIRPSHSCTVSKYPKRRPITRFRHKPIMLMLYRASC